MSSVLSRFGGLAILLLFAGCDEEQAAPAGFDWLPDGFPAPVVPDDNPMTAEKVDLGRHLFYEKQLSYNGTQSCGSCHQQALGFADGLPQAKGSTGDTHPRNAMGLTNVAYAQRLTWGHPTLNRLEQQALGPIFGENPVEMGMRSHEADLTARLAALPLYVEKFAAAFPDQAEPITLDNALKAIASFERTLISANSRYDQFVAGDEAAMNASEKRGMELYFDEVTECFHCHGGFNFSDATDFAGSVSATPAFHNTGLYNLNGSGDYPTRNGGIFEITGNREQMGQFRAPTLRNIAESKPYMHDGSVPDLEGVIDHYAAGGRTIESGPYAGAGYLNPYKDGFVRGFAISDQGKADLVAFLKALSDESFLTNPAFSDPFAAEGSAQ
jgi:cytochrome c peroxidase